MVTSYGSLNVCSLVNSICIGHLFVRHGRSLSILYQNRVAIVPFVDHVHQEGRRGLGLDGTWLLLGE